MARTNRQRPTPQPPSSPVLAGAQEGDAAAVLSAIIDSSDDAIIRKDLTGTILSWSPSAERIFGYRAAEIIGRPAAVLYPQDRMDEEARLLERLRQGSRVEHHEAIRRRKNGSLVEVFLSLSPIFDGQGAVTGVVQIARDLSDPKRALDRLRRSEERFRVTLSSIGDGVVATDLQGKVAFMNAVAERLTGWPAQDAYGRPLLEVFKIVNEFTRHTVTNPVARVLEMGETVGLANHTLLISKDGIEVPISDSGAPIRDPGGEMVGAVLVFRDVSEHRATELAAQRLAAIVEGSYDAIIGKDLHGIVTSWNTSAERIFGYTEAEMIGTSITRLIPPERLAEEQDILQRLQRGERVESFETVRVRKDGERIDVSLMISPIRDGDGTIVGASKVARDITEQRRSREQMAETRRQLENYARTLEDRVRERTAKLEESIGELEAFSYSLSHDMRAPLRAIQGFCEIVLADVADKIGPESTGHLQRVVSAASRMDRLIQDVLSFARLSRQDITPERLDVERLVREIIQERPELQPPNAQVVVESPLLPMLGQSASMTQCVTNLLDNAIKFVARGVSPLVTVSTTKEDNRIRLWITDNGIGIDDEGQRRLFTMFQRMHAEDRYQGTGVGLAIVRKAAERMGGRAGVVSTPGIGSRFWIELPSAGP